MGFGIVLLDRGNERLVVHRAGDLLTDIEDMVADTLKVGEHLRIEHTAFIGAFSGLHTVDLTLAEAFGHVVDLLLDGFDRVQVLAVCLIVQQQIKSIAADFLHLLDLDHDLLGEGNLFFFDHVGVFADVHSVVADALEVATDLALVEDVRNREEYIDYLNKEISKYISRMLVKERSCTGNPSGCAL